MINKNSSNCGNNNYDLTSDYDINDEKAEEEIKNLKLDHLEKSITCCICLEAFKKTSSLPCGHMLCSHCVKILKDYRSICPICKEPFHRRSVRPHVMLDDLVFLTKKILSKFIKI